MVAGMRRWSVTLLALVLVCGAAQAAGKRVAFVIGNAAYEGESRLANPHNDAALLAGVFRNDLKFDEVIQHRDLNRRQMFDLVREIGRKAKGADAIVVYYSGHGMRAPGGNYLIPVDARITEEDDVRRDALGAADIVEALQGSGARVGLLVLDACRDSPYSRRTRSGTKGLARMGVSGGNLLVAYATGEGATADDGKGSNSPYALALAQQLRDSSQSVLAQFDAVRRTVRDTTGGKQNPTREGDLEVGVHLVAAMGAARPAAPAPRPAQAGDGEQWAWDAAARANTEAGYRAYLQEYPQGRNAAAGRVALASLSNPRPAPPAARPSVEPAGPDEVFAPPSTGLPIPAVFAKYEGDMAASARCVGPLRNAVDRFEVVTDGVWSKEGIAGTALKNVVRYKAMGTGLLLVTPQPTSIQDAQQEFQSVATPFGAQWFASTTRWSGGVLSGGTQSMDIISSEVDCSDTLLPLTPGKSVSLRFANTTTTGGSGHSALSGNATRVVATTTTTLRVLDGPMSAEATLQRFKWLRLAGSTAQNWRFYEVEWASDMQYRDLQVPAAAREYYKPVKTESRMLFVEGPNIFVSGDSWAKNLRDGWTLSLRQLP